MFTTILSITSCLAFLSLFSRNRLVRVLLAAIIGIILIFFAGTRTSIVGGDYMEYQRLFSLFPNFEGLKASFFAIYEPVTILIPNLFLFIFGESNSLNATFLFFALVGVGTKMAAFGKRFFICFLVYICCFYLNQEMIAIRAGVAGGIFLLSIQDLSDGRNKRFFWKVLLALFFHYSSLIFLGIWFLERYVKNLKFYYFGLMASFCIAILKINILPLLGLQLFFPKIQFYLDLLNKLNEQAVNIFNFRILFSLFFFGLFLYKLKLVKNNKLFLTLFKTHIVSLILFFVLSPTAMVFSLRAYDLLSIGQVLLYPFVVVLFKEKWVGYLILIAFCIINFYYTIYTSNLFSTGYQSWLF